MPNPTRTYVSLGGQDDNLGDSVLRRRLLEALRRKGGDYRIYVGRHSEGYRAGLGLADSDHLYTSYSQWRRELLADALRGRAQYVHNAGEIQVNRSRVRNSILEGVVGAVGRLWGNPSILAGVGMRDPFAKIPAVLTLSLRVYAVLSWRDAPSRAAIGRGTVAPDWAFGIAGTHAGTESADRERRRVIVSMRSDRPALSDDSVEALRDLAHEGGLELVVLTQVKRDAASNAALAERLGCEHIDWIGEDHAEHEILVRAEFARAKLVVSDRLHALIIGFTEGAVPIGLATATDKKLDRTLAAGGLGGRVIDATGSRESVTADLSRLSDLTSVDEYIRRAALGVDELQTKMRNVAQRRQLSVDHAR